MSTLSTHATNKAIGVEEAFDFSDECLDEFERWSREGQLGLAKALEKIQRGLPVAPPRGCTRRTRLRLIRLDGCC